MKYLVVTLAALCAVGCGPVLADERSEDWGWNAWRSLIVQDQGRYKPLDTLARESLSAIAGHAHWPDPHSGETLDPVACYLTLLLDARRTASELAADTPSPSPDYFASHEPDAWDRAAIFPVDDPQLRALLQLAEDQPRISPWSLCQAVLTDPSSGQSLPVLVWADDMAAAEEQPRGLAREASQLSARLNQYLAVRAGFQLKIVPAGPDPAQSWVSVAELRRARFTERSDATGTLREVQSCWRQLLRAFEQHDAPRFRAVGETLLSLLETRGPTAGPYPARARITLELAYNRWRPMRWAAGTMFAAALLLGAAWRWPGRRRYLAGVVLFAVGLLLVVCGLAVRVAITQRAPVTNMYESVVFVGLGIGVLAIGLEWRGARQRSILAAAAATTGMLLLLAELSSAILDQGLQPLPAALRSNYWLLTHVITITLSYSAFALAMAVGNVTLAYYLARSHAWPRIEQLTRVNLRCIRYGTVLLALGTVAGGVWADDSWGRFWGWDPKEVWALIALLAYLAILHARQLSWVGHFGLAALAVVGFSLVVVAWYGVNYVLGTGLHSYGRGSGGEVVIIAMLFGQYAYLAAAALRSAGHAPAPRD